MNSRHGWRTVDGRLDGPNTVFKQAGMPVPGLHSVTETWPLINNSKGGVEVAFLAGLLRHPPLHFPALLVYPTRRCRDGGHPAVRRAGRFPPRRACSAHKWRRSRAFGGFDGGVRVSKNQRWPSSRCAVRGVGTGSVQDRNPRTGRVRNCLHQFSR